MELVVLQHVPFEDPGAVAGWARARGLPLRLVRLFAGEPLPDPAALAAEGAGLVVMGGPMSVHDEGEIPWLLPEKRCLAGALAAGVPTLGICLGAQLVAHVSGAAVTRNPERELGWLPVRFDAAARAHPLAAALPAELTVFHWHGETFALPRGAVALGASDACAHQGFLLGERCVGLQFHLEVTSAQLVGLRPYLVEDWNGGGAYVQQPDAIIEAAPRYSEAANRALYDLLGALFVFAPGRVC